MVEGVQLMLQKFVVALRRLMLKLAGLDEKLPLSIYDTKDFPSRYRHLSDRELERKFWADLEAAGYPQEVTDLLEALKSI